MGSSGLLGRHLTIEADRPSHQELDITQIIIPNKYDLIVHCAAYTNVEGAETDKWNCFNVNVNGTLNLLLAYPNTPIVYISSEYAHNPKNFYSLTKKMGEELVQTHPSYMIIRTLFKSTPWKYDHAFEDAYTQGDTVEIIAPLIDKEITEWSRTGKRMAYVGTGRKKIIDIARKSKPDVKPNLTTDIKGVVIPRDYI